MISPTEAKILSMLLNYPQGVFPADLIAHSNGELRRGTIYTTLGRLEECGLVRSQEVVDTQRNTLPRSLFFITESGQKARLDFGRFTGLIPQVV